MASSQFSALQTSPKPHLHIAGQQCPFCEQDIPADRLEEINGRIAARAQAQLSEATSRLREQHARDKAQADAKARDELEHAKRAAAIEAEKLRTEAAVREAAAREQATKTAEEAARAAERTRAGLTVQLQQVRGESRAAIEQEKRDAAAREAEIRAESARAAEAAVKDSLAAVEAAKTTAEQEKAAAVAAKAAAETELRSKLSAAGQQLQGLKEAHANEINQQREALEKDKTVSVNAERAKNLETKMKLEEQLADMQRRLQKKTADEHGKGAELELFDELKAAFPDDKIRRVEKGALGADIIHEVVENGKVCGKIVYDRKNRGKWQSAYAAKLRDDQIAEKADHAILSTNKFPDGEHQLCIREHVIVACPARVIALAALVRGHIVLAHELRVSSEAREEKEAELYAFITSERCRQLLDSVETLVKKMEELDVAEQKAHSAVWRKRGELLKSVLKANGVFCYELGRITGTAEEAE